jgi:hypothetical protein
MQMLSQKKGAVVRKNLKLKSKRDPKRKKVLKRKTPIHNNK